MFMSNRLLHIIRKYIYFMYSITYSGFESGPELDLGTDQAITVGIGSYTLDCRVWVHWIHVHSQSR